MESIIESLAQQPLTPMSLKALYKFGDNPSLEVFLKSAQFLHRELPVRFAQRIVMLQNLPHGLGDHQPIVKLWKWYARIIHEMLEMPKPDNNQRLHRFTCLVASINLDFLSMPIAVAKGMLEWRQHNGFDRVKWQDIDEALDRVFMRRLASTFLIDHYVAAESHRPDFAGVIQKHCSPVEVAEHAAKNVELLVRQALGCCPEIFVLGSKSQTFTYVPDHLFFILNELLKNSCRAVIEQHANLGMGLPPIKVIISRGEEDIAIKIEDEGGGMRRSDMDYIWSYNFSTAETPIEVRNAVLDQEKFGSLRCERSSLFGYGMGLPHSRLHARYFGGDLHLESMEGYGTDAYVHIPCLGVKAENLDSDFVQSSMLESRNGYYTGTKDGKSAAEIFEAGL